MRCLAPNRFTIQLQNFTIRRYSTLPLSTIWVFIFSIQREEFSLSRAAQPVFPIGQGRFFLLLRQRYNKTNRRPWHILFEFNWVGSLFCDLMSSHSYVYLILSHVILSFFTPIQFYYGFSLFNLVENLSLSGINKTFMTSKELQDTF